jgi:hypothetical protein
MSLSPQCAETALGRNERVRSTDGIRLSLLKGVFTRPQRCQPVSRWASELTDFTAGYGPSHSLRLVQAHSLESCVCENGSVSGEKQRTVIVPVCTTLANE